MSLFDPDDPRQVQNLERFRAQWTPEDEAALQEKLRAMRAAQQQESKS